jgi:2-deoxy-D-gluconate 3-dehydrogenase
MDFMKTLVQLLRMLRNSIISNTNRYTQKRRVAFITGAYGGIGKATIELMLNEGVSVAATGRTPPPSNDKYLQSINMDVTDPKSVVAAIEDCVQKFGRIDYLIHLAGMVGKGRLDQMELDAWNLVISTNLTSAFLVLKHGYPHIAKPGGVAILCGSSNGYKGGSHLSGPAYASSKAALVNLTRYCAKEWAADGIRVHTLSPGPVDTPMLERLSSEQHKDLKSKLPLGKYATANECAGAIMFLCSEYAQSMTGTNLNISSGLVLDP